MDPGWVVGDVLALPGEDLWHVERDPQREGTGSALLLDGRVVGSNLPAEVISHLEILRRRDDRLFTVTLITKRTLDVDEVPAPQLLASRVERVDRTLRLQRLVERGQALLTVEQQLLRRMHGGPVDARQRLGREVHVWPTGFQHHDYSDRVAEGDGGKQACNPWVVPLPFPLEVRQLHFAQANVLEQCTQVQVGAVKWHVLLPSGRIHGSAASSRGR